MLNVELSKMEFDLENLIRVNVKQLKPYSSARDDFKGDASIFLDANENPFQTDYNRYPDPHQKKLKVKIGSIKSVNPDQIFLGNGSDEPIDLLIRAFCEPGRDNVLIPQPTYSMYTVSAELNAVAIKTIPLTVDFDINLELTKKTWDDRTKLLFLCSPNNPSGNLLDFDNVQILLKEFSGIVVVDEAYIDFTNYDGFVPLLDRFPNLVILQTLSKAWGLASLRLGMCFASKEIIAVLNKIKPPYNINGVTQQIVLKSLEQADQKEKWVVQIIKEREFVTNELLKIPSIEHIYPSQANFLLVKIVNARNVYQTLITKGIVLRDRSNVLLCDECLRITIGASEENKMLLSELKKL